MHYKHVVNFSLLIVNIMHYKRIVNFSLLNQRACAVVLWMWISCIINMLLISFTGPKGTDCSLLNVNTMHFKHIVDFSLLDHRSQTVALWVWLSCIINTLLISVDWTKGLRLWYCECEYTHQWSRNWRGFWWGEAHRWWTWIWQWFMETVYETLYCYYQL